MRTDEERTFEERYAGMIGKSAELLAIFHSIDRVAPYFQTVLITGQTGTGKELAARAIHARSPACSGNFVTLNCSAVVETLFESELFGHVKGAFTDARQNKTGLLEHANGGTLFLDEIGDMPLTTQAKLLRALQNREVLPVGAVTPRRIDVRIIAATNKDLRAAVRAHEFREDLYYRLSMIEIEMPALVQREGDVPILAQRFGERWARTLGREFPGFTPEAMAVLNRYHWPGNVRELDNVVGRACILVGDGEVGVEDLPKYLREEPANGVGVAVPKLPIPAVLSANVSDVLEEYELQLVQQALTQCGRNQVHAAKILHTSRDRLRYKMKKFGILHANEHPHLLTA